MIFKDIHRCLTDNGIFLLFEQTGPKRKQWNTGVKRTVDDYIDFAHKSGFEVCEIKHMTFPIHRLFEVKLASYFYLIYRVIGKIFDKPQPGEILANKSIFFRAISRFLLGITRNPYKKTYDKAEGYTLFVFKKLAATRSSIWTI